MIFDRVSTIRNCNNYLIVKYGILNKGELIDFFNFYFKTAITLGT